MVSLNFHQADDLSVPNYQCMASLLLQGDPPCAPTGRQSYLHAQAFVFRCLKVICARDVAEDSAVSWTSANGFRLSCVGRLPTRGPRHGEGHGAPRPCAEGERQGLRPDGDRRRGPRQGRQVIN